MAEGTPTNITILHDDGTKKAPVYPQTTIPQVIDLEDRLVNVENTANTATQSRLFNNLGEMAIWIAGEENQSQVKPGDIFMNLNPTEPDYWWSGESLKPFKIDQDSLTSFIENTAANILLESSNVDISSIIENILIALAEKTQIVVSASEPQTLNNGDLWLKTTEP